MNDGQKIELEITNWPKASSKIPMLTVLVALLGYGITWYADRQTTLEKIHDDKVQFERQQLQASIDRKMVAYEKVEKAISNIRRIWYIARAKCAYDKSYATDPRKIEAVNLERWNARIDLMVESYRLDMSSFDETDAIKEIWNFNQWERQIKNICALNTPGEQDYIERQVQITKSLSHAIKLSQQRLAALGKQAGY